MEKGKGESREMKKYAALLRMKHYIKNMLILLPAFLVGEMFRPAILFRNLTGMIIFSFTASVVYIINDIRDFNEDRNHPVKRNRPIASGAVTKKCGLRIGWILFALCILLGVLDGDFVEMLGVPLAYLAINILYSMGLKNLPLIDVFILMLGYLLRLIYGGILGECGVSTWMFLTMMSVAFFMGFGKRRGELREFGYKNRKSLKIYGESFLDQGMMVSCTMAIIFYAMTCADTNSAIVNSGVDLLWSVPGGVLIAFRYLMLVQNGDNDGDPVSVILSDKIFVVMCGGFIVLLGFLLYG